MSFGDKPDWKRRALAAEAAVARAIEMLEHYTVSPEDAEAMRRAVWAERMIERWQPSVSRPEGDDRG